jgi:hypothetical protein
MNIKQFLKPDWRKIVITLILTFLATYLFWLGWQVPGSMILNSEARSADCCHIIITNQTEGLPEVCKNFNETYCIQFLADFEKRIQSQEIIKYTPFIIESLVISYLLSCLIVWLYDKIRKKK